MEEPEDKAEFYQSNDVLIFGGKMSMVEGEQLADVSEIAKEIVTSRGNKRK